MTCPSCAQAHPSDQPCRTLITTGRGLLGAGFASASASANGAAGATPVLSADTGEPADALLGSTVGHFRLARLLGRGGMGSVYLGVNEEIGSRVAVKVLHPELSTDPEMVGRFRAEASAANRIGHRAIVSILDLGTLPSGRHFMMMEFLEGTSLSELPVPMAPSRAVALLKEACAGLGAAHRAGVVHRDLKPENVFVVARGGQETVKLLDFGIAKLLDGGEGSTRTMVGVVMGTPEYMSPEQVLGSPLDGRSDLYALGVIAFWLFTGTLPFTGAWAKVMLAHQVEPVPDPRSHNPALAPALADVIVRALAKDPGERFQTADAFAKALEEALLAGSGAAATRKRSDEQTGDRSGLPAELFDRSGRRSVTVRDLSRAGAYVELASRPPSLRERVGIELAHPQGALRIPAEVVQVVSEEIAHAWGRPPGVAVQFCASAPEVVHRLAELLRGAAGGAKPGGDSTPARGATSTGEAETTATPGKSRAPSVDMAPRSGSRRLPPEADAATRRAAESLANELLPRLAGGLYVLLGVQPDASFGEIRRAAEALLDRLRPPLEAILPVPLAGQLRRIQDLIEAAKETLCEPRRRLAHDGASGNYPGVARCLAAGVRVDELAACRRRLMAARSQGEPATEVRLISARAWLEQGRPDRARQELERGLGEDPLHLDLHRQHAQVLRLLQGGAAARAETRVASFPEGR